VLPAALTAALSRTPRTTRPVVLIDGGAGSGKTTLATHLQADWPGPRFQLVGMDEFYPGWHGLAAASAMMPAVITGDGFTTWNWAHATPGPRRTLDPNAPLIIEGCGALTLASKALASLTIWLEAPEAVRRERALTRDGELFAPHWQQWAEQEAEHWRIDRPWELADITVNIAEPRADFEPI
jgi:uridine kinase